MDIEEVCHCCQRTLLSTDFEWVFYSCGHFICPHCISTCSYVCSCQTGSYLPNLTITGNSELKSLIKWCLRARFYEPLNYKACMEQLQAYIVECVICSKCNCYISQHSPCPNCPVPNWVCPKCNSPVDSQSPCCPICEKSGLDSKQLILETPIGMDRDIAIGRENPPQIPVLKENHRNSSINTYNEKPEISQYTLNKWICTCGVRNNCFVEKCRQCLRSKHVEDSHVEREPAAGDSWDCSVCKFEGLEGQMCGICGASRSQSDSNSLSKQQNSLSAISVAASSGAKAAGESPSQFPHPSNPPKPVPSYIPQETNTSKLRAASMAESRSLNATVSTVQTNTSGAQWICGSCEFKSNRIGATVCYLCGTPKNQLTREMQFPQ